jgi:hypothetical protein
VVIFHQSRSIWGWLKTSAGGFVRSFDPVSLRLFVAVCEEGNIAAAAQREAIVPSAISKRLAQMESEAGVRLFERGRRGVTGLPPSGGPVLI